MCRPTTIRSVPGDAAVRNRGQPEGSIMTHRSSPVNEALAHDGGETSPDRRIARRVRRLARLAVAAQVIFVASWLLAAAWQGPRYSVVGHSISDMYAMAAPGAAFLIIVITLCGAATMWFSWRSLRTVLRPAGRLATAGSVLLALSVFGLGDLLTVSEREACRLADPGCTAAKQLSNSGGTLDGTLTTVGLLLFVAAGFFLAAAMKRTAGWQAWVRPVRWWMALMIAAFIVDAIAQGAGFSGLAERLIALTGAAGIAVLAAGVSRRSESANS
jgi:Protein of unknown function (DUF998)